MAVFIVHLIFMKIKQKHPKILKVVTIQIFLQEIVIIQATHTLLLKPYTNMHQQQKLKENGVYLPPVF